MSQWCLLRLSGEPTTEKVCHIFFQMFLIKVHVFEIRMRVSHFLLYFFFIFYNYLQTILKNWEKTSGTKKRTTLEIGRKCKTSSKIFKNIKKNLIVRKNIFKKELKTSLEIDYKREIAKEGEWMREIHLNLQRKTLTILKIFSLRPRWRKRFSGWIVSA